MKNDYNQTFINELIKIQKKILDPPKREDSLTHWVSHIHLAKKENIEKGLKPEKYAEKTDLYSTFPEAIVAFMRYCNIIGWKEYFQGYSQIPMDFK
ncbi:hypothetical protein [Athalassotoga sp.]|uniref:hypothetical protein n=1 Tax=Athalassotoga sp. TaxID=2022597 RepID=UPI003D016853